MIIQYLLDVRRGNFLHAAPNLGYYSNAQEFGLPLPALGGGLFHYGLEVTVVGHSVESVKLFSPSLLILFAVNNISR